NRVITFRQFQRTIGITPRTNARTMTHAIQLPAIILPEDHRGVWISHALAWILFVSIPVVMASPAFAYMSMYVWLAQFLVLTLRSVIVFYLMYMVVVPALHSRGGLP